MQYYLMGECSEAFDVQQGVAQGCSLSPILFINGLLKEVEQARLGFCRMVGKRLVKCMNQGCKASA